MIHFVFRVVGWFAIKLHTTYRLSSFFCIVSEFIQTRMASTKQSKEKDPADIVNQNAIHIETIKKENKSQKVYTLFSINPYKRFHILTDKPMAGNKTHDKVQEDPAFLRALHRACLEPTKKYTHPQTESQEIGWISRPLIVSDRSDRRLNWSRQNSEITKYMDAAWRLKEQTQNLG
ncbi:cilia- and flagella-associated protein 144-like isoform 2-T2 [Salvelinus alpinus]|uniref:cilia- and flagella-associated protein 144-like isoform X1 n=1 Tax=Salvelinus sp. IW2-2015 TaxID=2691554 RepID=UPI000CDF68FA|nr:protein FAM183A-like isoform X1 [Salvelinus alpinus]